MTVIELPDELAAALKTKAAAEGLGLKEWLVRLVASEQKNTVMHGTATVVDEMKAPRPH